MGVFLMVITVDVASAGAQVGLSVVSKIVLGQSKRISGKIGGVAKSAELEESSGITSFHDFTYHQREKTSLGGIACYGLSTVANSTTQTSCILSQILGLSKLASHVSVA